MAGGGGARLWPASIPERPKQLLDPLLEARPSAPSRSLIARTIERLQPLVDGDDCWIVTRFDQVHGIEHALPDLPRTRILPEPEAKNTAAAIALFAVRLRSRFRDDDPTVMVFPADHHIEDPTTFEHCVRTACQHAEGLDTFVTLGIQPHEASTGYGYIERATEALAPVGLDECGPLFNVARFVEKPDEARARQFLQSGHFLWNAGIFIARLSTIEEALRVHTPLLWDALRPVAEALERGSEADVAAATAAAYASIPSLSIDVAVMEKAANLRVLPADFGWTDLGSWEAVYELARKDEDGNAKLWAGPEPIVLESRGCLAWSEQAQVALVGLEDVLVVQCGSRILVTHRDRAQDVRQILDELRRRDTDS